jgi:SAM-dependent methyltransferase
MSHDPQSLKARVARRYGLLASTFDRIGPPLFTLHGRRLVELAQVAPGERVLDVAAGRGAVLFAAAERVGPSGRVVGIDLTPEMVERTTQEIEERHLTNAEFRQMDAENLEFPDASFDCVLCGFGLFFLPHLRDALAEFHRVLRRGGRFGATTDGRSDERWVWWLELRRAYGVEARVAAQQLEDPADLVAALDAVGFADVRVVEDGFELVYADEDTWWDSQHVDLEGTMDPAILARLKATAFEKVRELKGPSGLHRWSRARYNLARKPA